MEMLTDGARGRSGIVRLGLMDSLYAGQSSLSQPFTKPGSEGWEVGERGSV